MALPPSTANWHWKNKNVTPWAKDWLSTELTTVTVTGDNGESASISEVTSVEGDVELGQRKSKLLTIFDVDVRLKWKGKTSSGTDVEGTLQIPEVSHEILCDNLSEFEFKWSLRTASSPEVDAVFKLAKTRLASALETKLAVLPSTMIEVHGKDIYISGSGAATPANGTATPPAPSTSAAAAAPARAPVAPVKKAASKPANTSTVTVEATFQAAADDLFSLLTDEKRIPAWTRNAAVSQAKADTEYSLFGGGVKGKYVSLAPGKEIVQTWALQSPTWPQGHEATLTTTFDQSTDSTKVTFSLAGVPTGMEDELRRNIEGYYVHGFKSIGLCS
ncbi:chaperone activator [Coprinopsis cinerea okayama7|uniref:Chaperone activator n=1 Tax=Coprinopsis cinerea (strain Okayama-7 / 130 / ATCC MYA-4618 / FGSC 9003) TaxID=240176 RepID=A8NE22_COPC7|nr:chaperone activator [Coprinopsis cinerea okayama7\|eukprot:XP_001832924.2 chaperone activator [Coprinopsis cinerea okayama7\